MSKEKVVDKATNQTREILVTDEELAVKEAAEAEKAEKIKQHKSKQSA